MSRCRTGRHPLVVLDSDCLARGINDASAIVGTYSESDGLPRGFLLDKGTFQTIHVPCAERTVLHDVTTRGDPIGHFVDHHGFVYGFTVTS